MAKTKEFLSIGNPFKLSLKDYKSIAKNNKTVNKAQRDVKKAQRQIRKGKYEDDHESYEKIMKTIEEMANKNEAQKEYIARHRKTTTEEVAEKVEAAVVEEVVEEVEEVKELTELDKFLDEKLRKTSELEIYEILLEKTKEQQLSTKVVNKILDLEASVSDKAWAIAYAYDTQDIIKDTIKYMTNEDANLDEYEDDPDDQKFINAIVKNYFGDKIVRPFSDAGIATLAGYDVLSAEFGGIDMAFMFASDDLKEAITNDMINAAASIRGVSNLPAVIDGTAKIEDAKTDEEKLNEIVKEIVLPTTEPVNFEQPVNLFAPASSNSSANIKFLNKYLKDLLGKKVKVEYYEDQVSGFINAQIGNRIFLVDPANIYGFGIWSVMALSSDVITDGVNTYNDTIMVPLNERDICAKVFDVNTNYIVTAAQAKKIQKSYCFDNMAIYRFVDLSATNTSEFIGKYTTKDIKAMGKVLDKMLPLMCGYRFRIAAIKSPTEFDLISDQYTKSPLASNGQTAMPCINPVVLTTASIAA